MEALSLLAQASDYTTTYADPQSVEPGVALGAALFGVFFGLLAAAVVYVISSLCLSRIFKKAGVETWKAWVPIYNSWVVLELGGQQGFWAVLTLIPLVNIVAVIFMFIAMYHIGLNLGKPGAFILLAIFFPLVWLIWLALDNSTWKGATPVAKAAAPATTATDDTSKTE
jgi:hypothetical protein